jgi:hypothetical protein
MKFCDCLQIKDQDQAGQGFLLFELTFTFQVINSDGMRSRFMSLIDSSFIALITRIQQCHSVVRYVYAES